MGNLGSGGTVMKLWKIINILLDIVLYGGAIINVLSGKGQWWDYICLSGIPLLAFFHIRKLSK